MNAGSTLESAVLPLDVARGATLRFVSRSALVTRVLGRRETRLAALGSVHVVVVFMLTLRWPVAMYLLGPVALGVVHVAADVRYLVFHASPPRTLLSASLVLAGVLTLVRACAGLHLLGPQWSAQIDLVVGSVWIALAVALRDAATPTRLLRIAPFYIAFVAFLLRHAAAVDLALTHVHNLAAFALWFALFRRRALLDWALLPGALVVVAALVLLSGAWLPWTAQRGGLFSFGLRAAHLGLGFAPGVRRDLAMPIAATFVFLQSIHYGVWTGWIPQECLPGEGSPTFRMTIRSLVRDFGRAGLAVIVVFTLGLAVAAGVHLRESVAWYMTLARAHVWFELAVFAYFVGRSDLLTTAATRAR